MNGPRYPNTCQHCTFLGRHGTIDLYVCMETELPNIVAVGTLIYISRPITGSVMKTDKIMRRGKQMAIDQGYWAEDLNDPITLGDALERLRH